MSAPSLMVQAAVLAALAADSVLVGEVTGIFDGVMPGTALPYVTLGPDSITDWSHKTGQGREHRIALSVWDEAAGSARIKALLARIESALLPLAGAADGWRIAGVLFVRSVIIRNPDGANQGIAEFRIRTEQI